MGNALYTIDSSEGQPILPSFGCVNLIALLADMENIKTKDDALKIAVK